MQSVTKDKATASWEEDTHPALDSGCGVSHGCICSVLHPGSGLATTYLMVQSGKQLIYFSMVEKNQKKNSWCYGKKEPEIQILISVHEVSLERNQHRFFGNLVVCGCLKCSDECLIVASEV